MVSLYKTPALFLTEHAGCGDVRHMEYATAKELARFEKLNQEKAKLIAARKALRLQIHSCNSERNRICAQWNRRARSVREKQARE